MSPLTQNFVAGVLASFRALTAFLAPTKLSLHRLDPAQWSGAFTCWGMENRKCPVRVPQSNDGRALTNFEIKTHDHLANSYYAVAAIVALGLHGINKQLPLPEPVQCDPADVLEEDKKRLSIKPLPKTVQESADFLLGEDGKPLQEAFGMPFLRSFTAPLIADAQTFKDKFDEEVSCFMKCY